MDVVRGDRFRAIAGANRRVVVNLLMKQELTINQVAGSFWISRSAIPRHVTVLADLVSLRLEEKGERNIAMPASSGL